MLQIILYTFWLNIFLACADARNKEFYCQEGTVSDIEFISSPLGVPIDYSYNETNYDRADGLSSVAGCPRSIDGYPWLYYETENPETLRRETRCYLAGTTGPCPLGQIIFVQPGSMFGVCGCECLMSSTAEYEEDTRKFQLCDGDGIIQIYDKTDKTVCHNELDQGPCPNGTLIAITGLNSGHVKTWNCLPVCDDNDGDSYEKYLRDECAFAVQVSGEGFVDNLQAHDCPDGEKYSTVLRKCIKKQPKKHILIG